MSDDKSTRLRTLVVEDEWAARDYLVELLQGSGLAQVVGAVATADEAREALRDGSASLDAVFLDVRLSGGANEGFEIAREIAETPTPPLVVLATALNAQARDVYDLGVADYLLKPFTEDRVEQCLKRLAARRPPARPARPLRIVARRQKVLVFLDSDEVWAFEGAERQTRVHAARGVFDIDVSLTALEVAFVGMLTRVHRNWLINVAHVKEFEHDGDPHVWVGTTQPPEPGLSVPVARDKVRSLRDTLLDQSIGLRGRRRA